MESPLALVCLIFSAALSIIYGSVLWHIAMAFPHIAVLLAALTGCVVLAQGAEWYRIYCRTSWDRS